MEDAPINSEKHLNALPGTSLRMFIPYFETATIRVLTGTHRQSLKDIAI